MTCWRRFPHVRAIGVAGNSRAMSPAEMDADAARGVRIAARARAGDSSTTKSARRSIRRRESAASAGRSRSASGAFQNRFVPLVVGSPELAAVLRLRQPVRPLGSRQPRLPPRSPPDDEPAPGHADGTKPTCACILRNRPSLPVELVDVLTLDRGAATGEAAAQRPRAASCCSTRSPTSTWRTIGEMIWSVQQRESKSRCLSPARLASKRRSRRTGRPTALLPSESKGFASAACGRSSRRDFRQLLAGDRPADRLGRRPWLRRSPARYARAR